MPKATKKKPRKKPLERLARIPGEEASKQLMAMSPEDRMALALHGLPKHLKPTGKNYLKP